VEKTSNHTILILDKALHALPWESLPCLDGVSVSRLPSLGCLRDQILNQHRRSGTDCPQEFTVDKSSGTYILNPGGDLKNTQSTFSGRFNSLSTWTSITERAPTEDEFREGLVKSDLFLYFGHGSGAQYIRGRSIKRLDRCAAAFLMGCSSGKLTEAGDFESFGTPWNYMHAGCPALVATLWDVTDKDIDRFATGTFERWGLLEKEISQETKPRGRKQKSKAKPAASATEDRVMALDEAVAKARGDCVLRYLNGAAPVIYGIPLYLR
jgi:separase